MNMTTSITRTAIAPQQAPVNGEIHNASRKESEDEPKGSIRICWQMKDRPPFLLLLKRTVLLECILKKDWFNAMKRLKSQPSESKTWAEISLGAYENIPTVDVSSNQSHSQTNESHSNNEGRDDTENSETQQQPQNNNSRSENVNNKPPAKCRSRVLPLHAALRNGAPLSFIKSLIDIYPKALCKTDSYYERNPLHFACLHFPREEVVAYLLQKAKGKVSQCDTLSRIPLHYAAFGMANSAVFDLLLNTYPEGASKGESRGWLPLHVAVKTKCNFAVLRRLVEVHPESLSAKTHKGSNVIQLATRFHGRGSPTESQMYALRAAVDAVYDSDNGRISLLYVSDAISPETNLQDQQGSTGASHVQQKCDAHISEPAIENQTNLFNVNENQTCVVCLEEDRTHAFVPCGHLCVCQACSFLSHRQGGMKCPLCRKRSFLIMKVFSS